MAAMDATNKWWRLGSIHRTQSTRTRAKTNGDAVCHMQTARNCLQSSHKYLATLWGITSDKPIRIWM
eukprot:290452-Lingulodinium_polyedra.AAC.1